MSTVNRELKDKNDELELLLAHEKRDKERYKATEKLRKRKPRKRSFLKNERGACCEDSGGEVVREITTPPYIAATEKLRKR